MGRLFFSSHEELMTCIFVTVNGDKSGCRLKERQGQQAPIHTFTNKSKTKQVQG